MLLVFLTNLFTIILLKWKEVIDQNFEDAELGRGFID